MTTEHEQPSVEDYVNTYQETQKRDKVGLLAEILALIAGGGAGYKLTSSIAGLFGANVITVVSPVTAAILRFLPTRLVSFVGLAATTTMTTPVGWIIGSTLACAGVAWGIASWVRSGGINDERRKALGQSILQKLEKIFHAQRQAQANPTADKPDIIPQVEELLHELAKEGVLQAERVSSYIEKLRAGKIPLSVILNILKEHGKELVNPTVNGDSEAALQTATSAHIFTALHKSASNQQEPDEAYLNAMQNRFYINRERALELYNDAPLDPNPIETANQLRAIFPSDILFSALEALQETAQSMAKGQAAFERFLQIQQILQNQFNQQVDNIDNAGDEARYAISRL
jgi:hypothetical protein